MTTGLFRWKAILPFLLVTGLIVVVWLLFGAEFVRRSSEEYATEALGAEVDIGGLRITESQARVTLTGLQVADPYDRTRNLFEAGRIVLDLDPVPLLEKKLVIDQMELTGLRFLVPRRSPAREIKSVGIAQRIRAQMGDWHHQFDVPLLSLTPVDTIKALVLDPSRLGTVQAAQTLTQQGDSVRKSLEGAIGAVQPGPVLDSARALAARLAATDPAKLGVAGSARAVADVKHALDQVARLKQQVAGLKQSAQSGVQLLGQGVKDLDAARQKDYQFARGLLQLPSISAPDISYLLFGPATASIFEQALYYTDLGRSYLPPGLDPLRKPGPRRLRMAGTTIAFPKLNSWPTFLLRQGKLGFSFGGDSTSGAFGATVQGLTSEPAIYGRPTLFSARGALQGALPLSVDLGGALDHVTATPRDSLRAAVGGLPLPAFTLPGLPYRLTPGRGDVAFAFALDGDRLRGAWSIRSNQLGAALVDSARGKAQTPIQALVGRVLGGVQQLELDARLGGTIQKPSLQINSNVGDALAGGLRTVLGQEVAKAEARVKAEVDRQTAQAVDQAQQLVSGVENDLARQIGLQSDQVAQVDALLRAQLKRYAGGAAGLLKLPKIPS
ncbi:MAG: TIGR03545 family protein [Gemmatimonadales bacterium]